jgi:hypothetical protein
MKSLVLFYRLVFLFKFWQMLEDISVVTYRIRSWYENIILKWILC